MRDAPGNSAAWTVGVERPKSSSTVPVDRRKSAPKTEPVGRRRRKKMVDLRTEYLKSGNDTP
jgi:hypothetical protein